MMWVLLAALGGAAPCATSCSAAPKGDVLDPQMLADLVDLLAVERDRDALDTLVFHAQQTSDWLDTHHDEGPGWLRAELGRSAVRARFRLVDDGVVMASADQLVENDKKKHVMLSGPAALGPIDVNGRVRRVGVDHLWARF